MSRRAASPPERRFGALVAFFAFEKHLAHQATDDLLAFAGLELHHPLEGRHAGFDQGAVVLRVVAPGHAVAPLDGAGVRVQFADEGADEGGFADAVGADDGDFVAAHDL